MFLCTTLIAIYGDLFQLRLYNKRKLSSKSWVKRFWINRFLNDVEDAESNLPYVIPQDLFGHQQNRLVTSQGWKNLKAFGIREG